MKIPKSDQFHAKFYEGYEKFVKQSDRTDSVGIEDYLKYLQKTDPNKYPREADLISGRTDNLAKYLEKLDSNQVFFPDQEKSKSNGSLINIHLEENDKLIYLDKDGRFIVSRDSIYYVMSDEDLNIEIALKPDEKPLVAAVNLYSKVQSETIPDWINQLPALKRLVILGFKLKTISRLNNSSLICLVLDIETTVDKQKIVEEVINLKNLKYLVVKNNLTAKEENKIRTGLPQLNIISYEEYEKNVESGIYDK